jgi:uncharacterized protein
MKTPRFSLSFALLLTFCVTTACTFFPKMAAHDTQTIDNSKLNRPFLWEIKHPKSKHISWLFGTIHVGVDADSELPASVFDKISRADCFVMEADISKINPLELSSMARMPRNETLSTKLSPTHWKKLRNRLVNVIPEIFLEESKPWFVTLNYMQLLYPSGVTPMDLVLYKKAQSQNKKTYFLEDWTEQIRIIEASSSIEDLVYLIDNEQEVTKQLNTLIENYREGSLEKLGSSMFSKSGMYTTKKQIELLLDERNLKWEPKIIEVLNNQSCVVAVGVGHMVGENGLINLLKKRNFSVSRMR